MGQGTPICHGIHGKMREAWYPSFLELNLKLSQSPTLIHLFIESPSLLIRKLQDGKDFAVLLTAVFPGHGNNVWCVIGSQ